MNLDEIKKLFIKIPALKKYTPIKIELLKGDASGRIYSRIFLDHRELETLILMQVTGGKGPIHSGKYDGNEDLAFLEISKILEEHKILAPQVIYSNLVDNIIITTDAGNFGLNEFCDPEKTSKDLTKKLLKQSVDILEKLQKINPKNTIFEKRFLSFEDYHRDASSVIDNFLIINNAKNSEIERTKILINNLCESIASHPKTIVHRDFMPWNLQVNEEEKVSLIDFQDSLIASSEFDIVCLLHDRDIDFLLEDDLIKEINSYYKKILDRNEHYKERYYEILIHRYTRLTGHFNLLTKKTGKDIYKNWVPGCIKRLARTISNLPELSDLVEILAKYDNLDLGKVKNFKL